VLGRRQSCIKGSLFELDRERKSALDVKTEGAGERWRPQGCTSGVVTRLPPARQENADIPALATKTMEPLLSLLHTHIHHSKTTDTCSIRGEARTHRMERTDMRTLYEAQIGLHARRPPICPHTLSTKKFSPSAANPSLPFQTLRHTRQLNASLFLFTFDLPLSPQKSEKKEGKGEGGGARQREGRGEEKMGGRRAPPPSLSISPLSLLPFSPSVS